MEKEFIDFAKGHVNELCDAMDRLGTAICKQGIGVSEKLDFASDRVAKALNGASITLMKTMDRATAASELHAQALVNATRALVGATVALVLITGILAYVTATHG